jgi:hypothetical protein
VAHQLSDKTISLDEDKDVATKLVGRDFMDWILDVLYGHQKNFPKYLASLLAED